jgi:hypothetical protein
LGDVGDVGLEGTAFGWRWRAVDGWVWVGGFGEGGWCGSAGGAGRWGVWCVAEASGLAAEVYAWDGRWLAVYRWRAVVCWCAVFRQRAVHRLCGINRRRAGRGWRMGVAASFCRRAGRRIIRVCYCWSWL